MFEVELVYVYDFDLVVVESVCLNVKLNKVSDMVEVKQNNLLDGIIGEYDVIVVNILVEVIFCFILQVYDLFKDGGYFIIFGIIGQKKQEVKEVLEKVGFIIIEILFMEDWVSIIVKK